jgi:hypothetical protein
MKKIKLPILITALAVLPCSSLFSQENEKLIKDYISQNKIREYKKSDLTNFIIENVDDSKLLNGNVVKFQQTYNGFPVHSSVGTALIKDNKVVYYTDNFVKNYAQATPGSAVINKSTALQKIAGELGNPAISNLPVLGFFEKETNNSGSAKQRLVYVNEKDGSLRLAYEYILKEPKSPNYWDILIDADNGKIIEKNNLTLSCNFASDAYSHDHSNDEILKKSLIGPEINNPVQQHSFSVLAPDNASYNVFALPTEAPTFGPRSIVANPWILTSSPEGWHSDGTNHYTITRGNNVYAYEDTVDADTPGFSPDGGASRNFDFPYTENGTSASYQSAAITNLFYMNNKIHDIFYKFGFTESARNFQKNNFGNGGLGNDHVLAEAQDGGGISNANFSTPQDGGSGRMQMYLWSQANRFFFYNAPAAAIPRLPNVKTAQFGPALTVTGVTGNVQLSSVLDGCTALPAGSLTGKIGLIERGSCTFTVKIKNAQDAGATAAIIYNATNSPAIGIMGGTDATVTIPSVIIENSEGEYIKSQLAANTTVNVTLKNDPATAVTPDGDFDNGIVTHEYGHGISNRLTGNGYSCLNASVDNEQMGEGWSDFFAIMLTNQPGDNASVPRGMGTYAGGEPTTGGGIRPAKYSPSFSINDYTYTKTNGLVVVQNGQASPHSHSIGFIWATMLWDLHWQYVAKYGYSSDVTANTTSGSARVLQMVINGLKLQGCNPSFIAGRDAIIAADQAATGGADKCMIWKTFAKRGLGVNASPGLLTPASSSVADVTAALSDQTEDFTVPAECLLATDEVKAVKNTISIYPNPAKNEFYINFPNNTLGKVSVEIYDMSGKLVSSENKISPDAKKAISTDKLVNGTYMVKVKGLGFDATSKVIVKK